MKKQLLSALCLMLFACSSPPPVNLQNISLGDEKGLVLHKLGNPDRTYYKDGTQRWVYKIKPASGSSFEKEVWFQEGKVVFIDQAPRGKKEAIQFEPVE